jgi:rod shape-determining protein MreD
MKNLTFREISIITVSFACAFALTIMPLTNWLSLCRPQWVALILIYWIIALPQRIGLGTAWLFGLILDSLSNTLLGEHALALVVIAYLAHYFHRQIRMYPLLQQALIIFVLIVIYQTLLLWVQGIIGQLDHNYWFWISALTSLLFWPWIFTLLRSLRRRSFDFN